MSKAKILIVDDEVDIIEILKYNLSKEDYKIKTANNGSKAIELAKEFKPHLIILDIMMPEMDGIEVCERLRSESQFKDTMIAFLTARSESFTHISALESGGDDFINKPIKPKVLKSRIKAILRRHPKFNNTEEVDAVREYGDLKIDSDQFSVTYKKTKINLAKKEFELLSLLASKPGKVFKRTEIMNKVWGSDVIVGDRTIDVHIRKLREKIGSSYIETLKGVGYKFNF